MKCANGINGINLTIFGFALFQRFGFAILQKVKQKSFFLVLSLCKYRFRTHFYFQNIFENN